MKTLYDVLGVPPNANAKTIREEYRKKQRKYHPDKIGNLSPQKKVNAIQRFSEIQKAYRILDDKDKRGQYDRKIDNINLNMEQLRLNYERDNQKLLGTSTPQPKFSLSSFNEQFEKQKNAEQTGYGQYMLENTKNNRSTTYDSNVDQLLSQPIVALPQIQNEFDTPMAFSSTSGGESSIVSGKGYMFNTDYSGVSEQGTNDYAQAFSGQVLSTEKLIDRPDSLRQSMRDLQKSRMEMESNVQYMSEQEHMQNMKRDEREYERQARKMVRQNKFQYNPNMQIGN